MKDQLIQNQKTFKLPSLSLMLVSLIIFMLCYLHTKSSNADSSTRIDLFTSSSQPDLVKQFGLSAKHKHIIQQHSNFNIPK